MKLSNDQLLAELEIEFERERKTSHTILIYLKEVQARKLYADRGYPNLFSMLIGYFRQSETAASQRIKAIALMSAVPEVEERLQNGDLNLSTLAMAQRQIFREEKETGIKVTTELKAEIVERISTKTMAQAEVELMQLLPASARRPETQERRVAEDAVRVHMTLSDELRKKLERLKEIWAHVNPSMDLVEVVDRAATIALDKNDPIRKATRQKAETVKPAGKRPTYYSVATDKTLWERANSQCEFVDERTGRRCDCTFGLERDHIIPLALGGSNEVTNLRLLCKAHNLLMARRYFGEGAAPRNRFGG